jgi:hypothetical protein
VRTSYKASPAIEALVEMDEDLFHKSLERISHE